MSHRIDIELTSATDAGWTWRAAGARQPKGVLDASLLYDGARVGDVVRAEAERELDGVRIVSVQAPRALKATGTERIELIARPDAGPSVSVQYADKPRGRDGDRRGPRREGDRGPRREGDRGPRREGADRGPRREGADRGSRPDRGPRPERGPRPDRPARAPRPDAAGRARPKRLSPARVHRDALIAELPPEQRPVAEQLLRGEILAVRQAIIDQNAQRKAAGEPEVPAAPLLALAEELLPRTRAAEWLDRAEAALESADDVAVRDLRALVTRADSVARDEASRDMAARLRAALDRRVETERSTWLADIAAAADESRLVRAVRLSARVPDPGAKLPAELVARLVAETNAALSADSPQDRWAALIEAAAEAPFRRDIVPAGLPANPGEALLATAGQASNRIPSLLKLLGLTIPPPPRAPRPAPARPAAAPSTTETPAADAAGGTAVDGTGEA